MIQLIVNADDFGWTRDVNEGIVYAHRNGILTATTMMAGGSEFEHAVKLARETPSLDVVLALFPRATVLARLWAAASASL